MKILHIITGLTTGGAERSIYNLLKGGLIQSFDNSVISLSDRGTFGQDIEALGVPVYCLNIKSPLGYLQGLLAFRKLIRDIEPDVIQGWMYHGNIVSVLGRSLCRGEPEVSWNIRHSLYDLSQEKFSIRLAIRVNRLLSGKVGKIVYNSRVSKNQHEKFGLNSSNGIIIPNGFDTNIWFQTLERKKSALARTGIPENAIVVGHIGRYHSMKGHDKFVRIAIKIANDFDNVHFLMIGKGVCENNFSQLFALNLELRARFHFPGEILDLPNLICAIDVLCLTSLFGEGFPNVIGEAMSSNIPCVASNVGDSASVVGETGHIVYSVEDDDFASALADILRIDNDSRRALGKSARDRIEKNTS